MSLFFIIVLKWNIEEYNSKRILFQKFLWYFLNKRKRSHDRFEVDTFIYELWNLINVIAYTYSLCPIGTFNIHVITCLIDNKRKISTSFKVKHFNLFIVFTYLCPVNMWLDFVHSAGCQKRLENRIYN